MSRTRSLLPQICCPVELCICSLCFGGPWKTTQSRPQSPVSLSVIGGSCKWCRHGYLFLALNPLNNDHNRKRQDKRPSEVCSQWELDEWHQLGHMPVLPHVPKSCPFFSEHATSSPLCIHFCQDLPSPLRGPGLQVPAGGQLTQVPSLGHLGLCWGSIAQCVPGHARGSPGAGSCVLAIMGGPLSAGREKNEVVAEEERGELGILEILSGVS